MKYIKKFENIDFDQWDEEEYDDDWKLVSFYPKDNPHWVNQVYIVKPYGKERTYHIYSNDIFTIMSNHNFHELDESQKKMVIGGDVSINVKPVNSDDYEMWDYNQIDKETKKIIS